MVYKYILLKNVKKYIEQNLATLEIDPFQISREPDVHVDFCLEISHDSENNEIDFSQFDESIIPQIVEEKPLEKPSHNEVEPISCCYSLKRIKGIDLKKLSERLETTWCSDVFWIIDEKGYRDSEVYRRAGVSKQTFSKLRNDVNYHPKRDTAIQLCIGLQINLDQTIDLLAKAGYTLSNASKRDLVVKYFVENEIYDIHELNYVLYEFKLELFNII